MMLKMTLFAAAFALSAAAYAAPAAAASVAPAAQPAPMAPMPAMPGMPVKPEAKKECCCDKMKADAAKAADGHSTH